MTGLRKDRRTIGMMGALLILGVLALSGCGRTYWYSASKDAASFKQDLFQCESEAALYSANMGQAGKKALVEKRLGECMKLRGYDRADESDVPKGAAKFE